MKHQIKHKHTGAVLFECELPDDTPAGLIDRHALEKATASGANLAGAYLAGADLDGANLTRANLAEAYLAGANLTRANLAEAYLAGADLDGANLAGANLARADLDGANLDGAMLVGERPIFQIGPIGSRYSYFTAYITTEGVKLRTGCFFGTVEEFNKKLSKEHGDNDHAKEYQAALLMIKSHADLWMPEVKATGEA